MKYVLQKSKKSYCKYCTGYVHLLIEKHSGFGPTPTFYICFECKRVFHVGIGEVERVELE
jgi:hypothetical protein